MTTILFVLLIPAVFVAAFEYFRRLDQSRQESVLQEARARAQKLRDEAARQAEDIRLKARHEAAQFRLEVREQMDQAAREQEEEMNEQEIHLERELARVESAIEETKSLSAALEERHSKLHMRQNEINELRNQRRELLSRLPQMLEERAGATHDEVRQKLFERMVAEEENIARETLRFWEHVPETDFIPKAKRVMGIAMGRITSTPVQDRPSAFVSFSSAQYQSLLKLCGGSLDRLSELFRIPVFVQEGEETVIRFDTIDAVSREVARRVLEKIADGTKSVSSWEMLAELWEKRNAEMKNEIIGLGRKAFKMVGLKPKAHPEIINLVGRLYFRTSYTQNQWLHSVEAAQLAGLIAAELHLDVELARRATLLHDIGKALTHEVEGSHALIGCELAAQYEEPPEVVNAIGAHHGEKDNEYIYTSLVMAADAMSGGRPGARREQMETYFDRISDLEHVARSFSGIQEAFAAQAGRELRVHVDSQRVDDVRTLAMAAEIARKVSEEVTFPGQIKVTVIRTFTAQETAR